MNDSGSQLLDAIVKNVGKRQPAIRRMDQYNLAGRIASEAWGLTEKEHVLSLEFLGGQNFKDAAEAAFNLVMLSGMATRFRFNGVEVSLTLIEDPRP